METNTLNMITLNGFNYHLWKLRMEDLLFVKGFHQPVFSSQKPEGKTNEEWNLLHRQVCGFIRQWVDDNVLNHVSREVDARTLWIKLEQMYAQKTITSKFFLIKQLTCLEFSDGNSMSDHLNVFQGIINQLTETGINFDDEVKVLWLLATLPDSWETFRTLFLNLGPDGVISLEMAKISILNEDAKRKTEGSASHSNDSVDKESSRKRADKESDRSINKGQSKRLCSRPPELQGLKSLKIYFHHATKHEVVIHTITLPKQSTVGDLINDLKTKVELSHKGAELRLLEVFSNRICKVSPLNEKIGNINYHFLMLRAEEIPDEQKYLGPPDRLISVFHFMQHEFKNQVQLLNFGEPFFLVIREGETFAKVKARIQKKLQVPDKEFSKWKVAILTSNPPTYLRDSDVVSTLTPSIWDPYLGLEHSIPQIR